MSKQTKITEFVSIGGAALAAGALGATGVAAQNAPDGFYVGLTAGTNSSSAVSFFNGSGYSFSGGSFGAFAGYNVSSGNTVFGGEVLYTKEIKGDDPLLTIDNLVEVRGRIGQVLGDAFVYGAIGFLNGGGTYNALDQGNVKGTVLAIGAEMPIAGNAFIGAEVAQRRLEDDNSQSVNINAIAVRGGFRF